MSTSSVPAQLPIPVLVLAFALLAFLSGCGGGKASLAPAKGKVVCNGQPVTGGTVALIPLGEGGGEGGRPARCTVGPDGTFVLTTYDPSDGAAVGKHRVEYAGPEDEDEEEEEGGELAPDVEPAPRRQVQQKPQYVLAGEMIVEVKDDGENDFTIEVMPAGMKQAANRTMGEGDRSEE